MDVTRQAGAAGRISGFMQEEEVEPGQIGAYKVEAHRSFVNGWSKRRGLDPERVWRAREACIAALAR